ncbi:MAG TPA: ATP-binding protein [Spirochaetota bacterium]|nr:ATP-binding protein [Spirochaetota bacterium]
MISRDYYLQKIMPFIDKPLIKVITGMRRSSKSSIMKLLIDNLINNGILKDNIIYINMELLSNEKFSDIHLLNDYIMEYKKKSLANLYLFIDEIQEIVSWEKLVNSLLSDGNIDIIITGSNSKLLSGELSTFLTGRYIEFHIFPLSFSEFLTFRNIGEYSDSDFYDFIKYGGLPGIHQIEFEFDFIIQYLSSVNDSIIFKDVVMRNNIRDSSLLEKLIIFIASNIGNIFSARSIADYLKKERRSLGIETIYNYIKYLETAFFINKVERYDILGKKLLETHEKYYLTDIGLRNAMLGFRENDINAYLENIVYLELKKRDYDIYIGKIDNYEIDFIAERNSEKIYIQVAYLLADENIREREYRPFYKIKDNYPKYILTMDKTPTTNTDGIIRKYLPDFLIEES